ncbi:cytochrome P450 [Polaromonas sp. JS666]|uniref:cytochrome P450 n=1 Tax=Polaromonas sp. (strain JS666 / ATCC BAA-500) TaxID=296591 RepID=UPI0000464753|nr:cytochrome P450 [Polaromonas sp. JS666]ABE43520.1 cytochrome P450 [Polaromonas sp. JS666]
MNADLRPPAPAYPIIDAAFLANPYPTYDALREAGAIHWSEEFFGGAWLVTRHADVELVLRDPRFSAQRTGAWVKDREETSGELSGFQQLFARALLFLDAPDHPRIRKVLHAGFRMDVLQRLVPHIEQAVTELLDQGEGADCFDFIETVARPLPVRVITRLLGIENLQYDDFMAWSEDLASFIGAPQPTRGQARRAQVSLLAMSRYFETLLEQKRQTPGDDLTSRLAQAEARGEIQGGAELLAQCAMLLFAGFETTRHLLGSGLQALLAHPDQWQRLQQAPELLPGAVRELLRFDSPVQYTGRRVSTDLVLHGQQLRRGDLVVPLIGAANRDPRRYAQPDVLDITRRDGSSLSFGSGPHVCIGAALTLMEAEIVFQQLLRRWPELSLVDATPRRITNPLYRGLVTLPLRCRAPA